MPCVSKLEKVDLPRELIIQSMHRFTPGLIVNLFETVRWDVIICKHNISFSFVAFDKSGSSVNKYFGIS